MKRLLSGSFLIALFILSVSCGTNNGKMNQTQASGTAGNSTNVEHDTINMKVEIKHQGADQKRIDSIKDEKTKKKK